MITTLAATDPRLEAYHSRRGPDVFHSVAYAQEIWRPDPFDVQALHADAREQFDRLLQRATSAPTSGRVLLMLGEAGSGKTHLMRAFRNKVHGERLGYCGYMQMTTFTTNYPRYVLHNLIESLDHVYFEPDGDITGLMRLANAVAETPHSILTSERFKLRAGNFEYQELADYIDHLADLIVSDGPFQNLDIDLIKAFLYLQREDPVIKSRVLKYLRCEDLSRYDREVLGDLPPRSDDGDPLKVIELIGKVAGVVNSEALVLCIDQLEDTFNLDRADWRFGQVTATACAIANVIPSAIVVISCLEDFYEKTKGSLKNPIRDRLERDPDPIRLRGPRTIDEVRALVAARMRHLYDALDVAHDDEDPTYPITELELSRLTNMRTRDIIDWCRQHREKPSVGERESTSPQSVPAAVPDTPLSQKWNDYRIGIAVDVPPTDSERVELLSWAIGQCSAEITSGHWFEAEAEKLCVAVEIHMPGNRVGRLLVALCDKAPQGGALSKQIGQALERAGEHTLVIARSTPFPVSRQSEVNRRLGEIVKRGGRRVSIEDSEWRTMVAWRKFLVENRQHPNVDAWVQGEKPLHNLHSIKTILNLDHLDLMPETAAETVQPTPKPTEPEPAKTVSAMIQLGTTAGRVPQNLEMAPHLLTSHAAFLGGTGSGKTTLALNVMEQLLEQGIPVVLLDRKGDLCGYARKDAGLRDLQARLDVAVFTPGNPDGRPLQIPLVPEGTHLLPSSEQDKVAGWAAYSLGGMMGYKDKGTEKSRLAILRQAILVLVEDEAAVTLEALVEMLHEQDATLLSRIGKLDPKLFKRLVQDLETLNLSKGDLFRASGERLEAASLFRRQAKTKLTVISTKFLGDTSSIEFWVTQFLLELTRWMSKHPSKELQAVVFMDEADAYMPAQKKPATKEPLENLLKRARSAGLGLLLATQNPGDFDYRCRDNIATWFLGRITQQTSQDKLKPLVAGCRGDVLSRLAGQQPGEFQWVREQEAVAFRGNPSRLKTEQLPEEEIQVLAAKR